MKIVFLFVISLLLLQVFVEPLSAHISGGDRDEAAGLYRKRRPIKKIINCGHACAMRCRDASRKNVCNRACKSCCTTCHCVPPGTYGHKSMCPCYARLRTHGHKLKCP